MRVVKYEDYGLELMIFQWLQPIRNDITYVNNPHILLLILKHTLDWGCEDQWRSPGWTFRLINIYYRNTVTLFYCVLYSRNAQVTFVEELKI